MEQYLRNIKHAQQGDDSGEPVDSAGRVEVGHFVDVSVERCGPNGRQRLQESYQSKHFT